MPALAAFNQKNGNNKAFGRTKTVLTAFNRESSGVNRIQPGKGGVNGV